MAVVAGLKNGLAHCVSVGHVVQVSIEKRDTAVFGIAVDQRVTVDKADNALS